VLKRAKNSLNVLYISFRFTSSFRASKALPTSRHSKACLPFFPIGLIIQRKDPQGITIHAGLL
jgi:hypothetical protein